MIWTRTVAALSSVFLAFSTPALAVPPAPVLRDAIEGSPMLATARAEIERARATAARLRVGGYEVRVQGGGGRRIVDTPVGAEDRFTEWTAGISRSVRLPGKRKADHSIAGLEIAVAEAEYAAARRRAETAFIDAWSSWRRAHELAGLAERTAAAASRLADAQRQAAEIGGARQLSVDQLAAQAGLYEVEATSLRAEAGNARTSLAALFPALPIPDRPVPADWSRKRIRELLAVEPPVAPAAEAARLAADRADAAARRARLERAPDPLVGLQVAQEFGGDETSFMATLSVPIGGRARKASAAEASASSAAMLARLTSAEREAEQRFAAAERSARAALSNLEVAAAAQESIRRAMERLEKGAAIKAVTLNEVMLVRRNLYDAERSLIERRVEAERAFMMLSVMHNQFAR